MTSITTTALAILPMALHYLSVARLVGRRDWRDVWWLVPNFPNFLMHPAIFDFLPTNGWLRLRGETSIFFGLAVFATGWWFIRSRVKARKDPPFASSLSFGNRIFLQEIGFYMSAASLLLIAVAARWPTGSTPWWIVYHLLPGASAIRAVSRFVIVILLPASILVGVALTMMNQIFSDRRRWLYPMLLMMLIAAENFKVVQYSYSKQEHLARLESLVQRLEKLTPCDAFYNADSTPEGTPDLLRQTDSVWLSLVTSIPTINGYSGGYPPGYADFMKIQSTEALRDALHSWTVTAGREVPRNKICIIRGAS